jgi:hypothetical protein
MNLCFDIIYTYVYVRVYIVLYNLDTDSVIK